MMDGALEELISQTNADRRALVAGRWDVATAAALMKNGKADPEDIRLCCESLLLHALTLRRGWASLGALDQFLGEGFGVLVDAMGGGVEAEMLLEKVLSERVAWPRLTELAWLMHRRQLAELMLQGPMASHPLATTLLDPDLSHHFAHVRVAWDWELTPEGNIEFPLKPAPGEPMNKTLRRVFTAQISNVE